MYCMYSCTQYVYLHGLVYNLPSSFRGSPTELDAYIFKPSLLLHSRGTLSYIYMLNTFSLTLHLGLIISYEYIYIPSYIYIVRYIYLDRENMYVTLENIYVTLGFEPTTSASHDRRLSH